MPTTTTDTRRRVAVLGATGCVGRHVCDAFANEGFDVVGIARGPAPHDTSYRILSMDVAGSQSRDVAAILADEQVEVVVNATGSWSNDADELTYAHVQLLERLVEGLALMPSRPRLVHVGTFHEYGPIPHGVSADETVVPAPETIYAQTKLAGSQRILDAARAGELDGVVLRVSNIYGPHPATASFLGSLSAALRTVDAQIGLELTIAEARRDYVDVRDVADAVIRAARAPVAGQVVNIGRGVAVSMRELVYALVDVAGLPPTVIRERAAAVESKGGDWTMVDNTRAGRLLGWRPRFALLESVRAMWETTDAARI